MRRYETTYIVRPGLSEDQIAAIIERTNAIITDAGGSIIFFDRWGMRKLAYEIKKETQGLYLYMDYAAPGHIITEIERIFKIDDNLLRYLTIQLSNSIDEATIEAERNRLEETPISAPESEEDEESSASESKADEADKTNAETATEEKAAETDDDAGTDADADADNDPGTDADSSDSAEDK